MKPCHLFVDRQFFFFRYHTSHRLKIYFEIAAFVWHMVDNELNWELSWSGLTYFILWSVKSSWYKVTLKKIQVSTIIIYRYQSVDRLQFIVILLFKLLHFMFTLHILSGFYLPHVTCHFYWNATESFLNGKLKCGCITFVGFVEWDCHF